MYVIIYILVTLAYTRDTYVEADTSIFIFGILAMDFFHFVPSIPWRPSWNGSFTWEFVTCDLPGYLATFPETNNIAPENG